MKTKTVTANLNYPIEKVWEIVTDNRNYTWRRDLSKIIVQDEQHFSEFDNNGFETQFTITKKEAFNCYEFDIVNKNIHGKWEGEFSEIASGTKIKFTESIASKYWLMNLVLGIYLKKQQKNYLADLQKELENRARC